MKEQCYFHCYKDRKMSLTKRKIIYTWPDFEFFSFLVELLRSKEIDYNKKRKYLRVSERVRQVVDEHSRRTVFTLFASSVFLIFSHRSVWQARKCKWSCFWFEPKISKTSADLFEGCKRAAASWCGLELTRPIWFVEAQTKWT